MGRRGLLTRTQIMASKGARATPSTHNRARDFDPGAWISDDSGAPMACATWRGRSVLGRQGGRPGGGGDLGASGSCERARHDGGRRHDGPFAFRPGPEVEEGERDQCKEKDAGDQGPSRGAPARGASHALKRPQDRRRGRSGGFARIRGTIGSCAEDDVETACCCCAIAPPARIAPRESNSDAAGARPRSAGNRSALRGPAEVHGPHSAAVASQARRVIMLRLRRVGRGARVPRRRWPGAVCSVARGSRRACRARAPARCPAAIPRTTCGYQPCR